MKERARGGPSLLEPPILLPLELQSYKLKTLDSPARTASFLCVELTLHQLVFTPGLAGRNRLGVPASRPALGRFRDWRSHNMA